MVPAFRGSCLFVVSDWGSYLGSHFPFVLCGMLSRYSCLWALLWASRFGFFFFLRFIVFVFVLFLHFFSKIKGWKHHAASWSARYNDRDIMFNLCMHSLSWLLPFPYINLPPLFNVWFMGNSSIFHVFFWFVNYIMKPYDPNQSLIAVTITINMTVNLLGLREAKLSSNMFSRLVTFFYQPACFLTLFPKTLQTARWVEYIHSPEQ